MPRPRKIIRPRKLTIMLPEDVAAKLELYLANLSDGKVPQGAYQTFFVDRINEFFVRLSVPKALEEVQMVPFSQEISHG